MAKKPDRWSNYSGIGKPIHGTRFIAFKVPLKNSFDLNRANKDDLSLDVLLRSIPKLGLVIDLTHTTRYYSPLDLERRGVQYVKIMVPGHVIPTPGLVHQFEATVDSFLENNEDNDRLIGVHCTHGVNRTGYFLCRYMIKCLNMSPPEAIQRFNEARGHKIERGNYLKDLRLMRPDPKPLVSNGRSRSPPAYRSNKPLPVPQMVPVNVKGVREKLPSWSVQPAKQEKPQVDPPNPVYEYNYGSHFRNDERRSTPRQVRRSPLFAYDDDLGEPRVSARPLVQPYPPSVTYADYLNGNCNAVTAYNDATLGTTNNLPDCYIAPHGYSNNEAAGQEGYQYPLQLTQHDTMLQNYDYSWYNADYSKYHFYNPNYTPQTYHNDMSNAPEWPTLDEQKAFPNNFSRNPSGRQYNNHGSPGTDSEFTRRQSRFEGRSWSRYTNSNLRYSKSHHPYASSSNRATQSRK